jgi:peptidoglycan/LPS O-acetylase OafA/YrhL
MASTIRTAEYKPSRLIQLDILRGVAVLLVLGFHAPLPPETAHLLRPLASVWQRFGWSGVDLFFVLSGFLVGGLLFKELRTRSRLDVRRFLIRRGFKIWPAYYVFVAFLLVRELAKGSTLGAAFRDLIPQLIHLQNYVGAGKLAPHTWTLAVEEHFYLALPGVLLLLTRGKKGDLSAIPAIPYIAIGLIAACTAGRYFNHTGLVGETHLRIDSLFFGVLLAYLYHFRPQALQPIARFRGVFFLLGVGLISPMLFVNARHVFVYTFGFVFLYAGYGLILLTLLHTPVGSGPAGRLMASLPARLVAFIGLHSYSIYLWHVSFALRPAEAIGVWWKALPGDAAWLLGMTFYLSLAVGVGVLLGKLIEMPALRLRESLFPAPAPSPVEPRPVSPAPGEDAPVVPPGLLSPRLGG